jgi:hypothetical protein
MMLLAQASIEVLVFILASGSVGTSAPPSFAFCKLEIASQRKTRPAAERCIWLITVVMRTCRLAIIRACLTGVFAFFTSADDHGSCY